MVAGKSLEPLPPGWVEHEKVKNGRTTKYYTNAESGKKFYSKKAVLEYTKARDVFHGQNQGINNHSESENQGTGNGDGQNQGISNGDGSRAIYNDDGQHQEINEHGNTTPSLKVTQKTDKSLEVPPGWTVELKTRMGGFRNGETYKCYVSPSGKKLYSKAKVSQYLTSAGNNNLIELGEKDNVDESSSNPEVSQDHNTPNEVQGHTSRKQKSDLEEDNSKLVFSSPAAVDGSVDGLPMGWIKEMRKRTSGIRKDPCYIDPISGYEFRSKRDVLRYVETGDINKCVLKPKKRDRESACKNINPNIEDSSSNLGESQNKTTIEDNGQLARPPIKQKSGMKKIPTEIVYSAALQNDVVDELPPGWIKEYVTRRDASGKKDPFYTDPVSGYIFRSKKDVWRYIETGDIQKCVMKPLKKDLGSTLSDTSHANENSSPKPRVPRNKKALNAKCVLSKKKRSGIGKRTSKFSVLADEVDGLPPGWIREFRTRKRAQRFGTGIKRDPYYIHLESGFEFRSKKDALRYIKTGDIAKCVMKPMKRDPVSAIKDNPIQHDVVEELASKLKESQNDTPVEAVEEPIQISEQQKSTPTEIGVQNAELNGLPPGWIKEIRTRTTQAGGIREDPYYIDPVSEYVFRSKKDALRYLESGDIRKCIMKPTKKFLGSTTPNNLSTHQLDTDKEKESESWTKEQLFDGKEMKGSVRSGSEIKESFAPRDAVGPPPPVHAEGSNKRMRSITYDFINANSVGAINAVKQPPHRRSNKGSGTNSRTKQTPKSGQTKTRKSTNNKGPTMPGRVSNRLAQHKTEVANLGKHDRIELDTALSPSSCNPSENLVSNLGLGDLGFECGYIPTSSGIDINSSWGPNDPVQKVVADLGLGEEEIIQASVVNSGGIDVNTCMGPIPHHSDGANNKPTTNIYSRPHNEGGNNEVDVNLPLPNPQAHYLAGEDCWTDRCLDFTLKTLTGGMAAGENSQDHRRGGDGQQQEPFIPPTYTQVDRCFTLPVFDLPHSGIQQQSSSSMMNSSPLLPPGFSLPSYSGIRGSQHFNLDDRKDYPPSNL
ncbi:unnamed protein product [Cuscuta epithymum]|uniref:MBD domain-containing protein n=1 Tax=Cuscuta epithymum TaxID=186058 RepID=A0AAV0DBX6_9ASTE|nr:unnamed protein product [Cuscuta epithymum]